MKIAVIRFSALGDLAASLPILRALDYKPCIITSPIGYELMKDEFDDFIILKNKKIIEVIRAILAIRKKGFDFIIDLQNNDRSRAMTWLSSVRCFRRAEISYNQPVTDMLYAIAGQSGFIKDLDYQPRQEPGFYIVLNVGSSPQWESKRLPVWKWKEIGHVLYNRYHLKFVMVGDQQEQKYVNEVAKEIVGEVDVIAGKTSIQELKAILKDAFLTVSTDSGPMHISAVMKTPTIGLFGATNWVRSSPYGSWSTVLYDHSCYPDGKPPPHGLTEVGSYYDNINIDEGLDALQDVLE
ncbi:MAG: glycosyltransferase family 9 protein [Gammaproteobacteria bacterium]|nr:glycosyltransferase family 9 protein [Gammaproteobacteria bacterium]